MQEEEIKKIILLGENINTEFKEAQFQLPKNIFSTVCAFLNTVGGYIFLGVNDNREIVGIDEKVKDKLKKDFSTICNNKQSLDPTIVSELKEIEIDGKLILYTHIDESDSIHKYNGKVYMRNYEGDFNISENYSLIASIHNKKRKIFDEDKIFPHVSVENDLRADLIDKARKYANANVKKTHPWMEMTDLELLKSAGLYRKDIETRTEGVTLAGIMLFGKDEIIHNINPYCRTDAIYRVDDLDRYDDRDFVETNLLDMYDRLIDFIAKHTMDRFALDETMRRVSPRNVFARELVLNSIMHRDLTDGHTSRIIIYKDKIICENPNLFRTMEMLDLKNYTPFAKNPTLAKFFREIGYADELGSGFIKITKNSYLYSGKPPIFEDKAMFKVTIPLLRDKQLDEKDLINLANDCITDTLNDTLSDTLTSSDTLNDTLNDTLALSDTLNDTLNDTLTSSDTLNDTLNDTLTLSDTLNNNQISISILDLIHANSKITQKEISDELDISIIKIKRTMKKLQEDGVIQRIGTKKKGYWKVKSS